MLQIRKASYEDKEYFVIFLGDECYMQRTKIEDQPKPGEKALIRVCEYMIEQENSHAS